MVDSRLCAVVFALWVALSLLTAVLKQSPCVISCKPVEGDEENILLAKHDMHLFRGGVSKNDQTHGIRVQL